MPAEIMEPLQRQVASIFEGGPSVRADVHYPTMFGNCFYEYFLDPVYGVGNQIGNCLPLWVDCCREHEGLT